MTGYPYTNSKPHECPACGAYKPDADDYCVACRNYRDNLAEENRKEREAEQMRKRIAYWRLQDV